MSSTKPKALVDPIFEKRLRILAATPLGHPCRTKWLNGAYARVKELEAAVADMRDRLIKEI